MRLSNHAFYNGSSDNITCVLVSAEKKGAIATIPNNSSVE
jgi:serine/threonine protein phosphatase PrpC